MPERAESYKKKAKPGVRKHNANPSAEGERANSAQRGYGYDWQTAREHYLRDNPLCVTCEKSGYVVEATVVDHIKPHRGNSGLFWALSNWQSLCVGCHNRKTGKGQ